jgi:hypothetical protein
MDYDPVADTLSRVTSAQRKLIHFDFGAAECSAGRELTHAEKADAIDRLAAAGWLDASDETIYATFPLLRK